MSSCHHLFVRCSRPHIETDPARIARADLLKTGAVWVRGPKLDAVGAEAGLVALCFGHVAVAQTAVVTQIIAVVGMVLERGHLVALLALAGHGTVNGAADAVLVGRGGRGCRGSAGQCADTFVCGGAAAPVAIARDGRVCGAGGHLAAAQTKGSTQKAAAAAAGRRDAAVVAGHCGCGRAGLADHAAPAIFESHDEEERGESGKREVKSDVERDWRQ